MFFPTSHCFVGSQNSGGWLVARRFPKFGPRILPQGRKLEELKVSETLQSTLPEPKDVKNLPEVFVEYEEEEE